jgi:hypothetical protein
MSASKISGPSALWSWMGHWVSVFGLLWRTVQGTQIYSSKQATIASIKRCSNECFLRKNRVKLQVMLELNLNWLLIDRGFLVAPCLVTRVLFGLFCCVKNHVIIDFPGRNLIVNSDGSDKSTEISFVCVEWQDCNPEVQHGRPLTYSPQPVT